LDGYEPCTIRESVIDVYVEYTGRITHVSRNNSDIWSSKLGSNIRMIHPRFELQGSDYNFIEVFYAPSPARSSTPSSY